MQTFLPYPDFKSSVKCLDWRRLGKQRVEALQILHIITLGHSGNGKKRWNNHPAVRMWCGYPNALSLYMNCCIKEWLRRGYNNNMRIVEITPQFEYPIWFGNKDFHAAHRSNLLRKNNKWYCQFGWSEPNDLPYVWPVKKSEIKK